MNPCHCINRTGLIRLLLILILTFAILDHSLAQQSASPANASHDIDAGYRLFVNGDRISLTAEAASLKSILEAIGRQMSIDLVAYLPGSKKISIKFENRSLEEALTAFKVNYALVSDSKDKGGAIKRIVVVPAGQQANLAMTPAGNAGRHNQSDGDQEYRPRPEPFKFEFDPSKLLVQPKPGKVVDSKE